MQIGSDDQKNLPGTPPIKPADDNSVINVAPPVAIEPPANQAEEKATDIQPATDQIQKAEDKIEVAEAPTIPSANPAPASEAIKPEAAPAPTPTEPTPAEPAQVFEKPPIDQAPQTETPPQAPRSSMDNINKGVFQIKPQTSAPEMTTPTEPQIGVQLEDEKPEQKPATNISVTEDISSQPFPNTNQKPEPDFTPLKSQTDDILPQAKNNHSKTAAITTVVAVGFLALGLAGGYFGYNYSPKIASLFSASADAPIDSETTQPESASEETGAVSTWPIYSNSKYKYSIKYPDNWYSQGVNSAETDSLKFTSNNPQNTETTGLKVEINVQASNGKTLKNWIEANNTAANTKSGALTTLKINGQEAYQQTTTGTTKTIKTYISRTDQVLIVTYSGSSAKFDEGKTLYKQMIDSIKLM